MPTMTPETFAKKLKEQRPFKDIKKWRDLEKDRIYEVISKETVKTKNGNALVITLEDQTKVWACSTLAKRLEDDKDKTFPCHVRPIGKIKSQENPSYQYYGIELVWSE